MFSLKILVTFLLCQERATSHDILLPKVVEDYCFSKILGDITKNENFVVITWSHGHHVNNNLKDDIWKVFEEKSKLILNNEKRLKTPNNINRTPGTILLLASTNGDIVEGISSLSVANAWSFKTKFIILYLEKSGHKITTLTDQFVREVFYAFASLNTGDVHFIYEYDNSFASTFTIFSYKDIIYGETEPVGGSECALHQILYANIFESESTIKAAVRSYEPYSRDVEFAKDVEIDLVRALARWAHLDVELKVVDYPELKDKSFNIIIGAPNQMKNKLPQSIDFDFDALTWCVKKADVYPKWRSFFFIGTWEAWAATAFGVYYIAGTLYVFFHYYHHPQNFHYCTGMAALCFLSIPMPYNPTHGIARMHFGVVLIYGLLAVILINSFLVSMMTTTKYQYQIQTTDELMYYHYKILIDEEILSFQHFGDDEISSYTKQNYERCDGMTGCLSQVLERSNVATIVRRKLARHFESKLNSPIYCFDSSESFNRVTRSLTLGRSNSRLLNKTNSFIRRAMETGHLLKWEAISAARKKYEDERNGPVVLTVEHMSVLILTYVFGMTVALLMFIGEWLTFKNIQKGGGWKFLDKYIFSPERLIWKSSSSASN